MPQPTIAVVGATGTIGRQILHSLHRHDVEAEQLRLFSSERSEGEELEYDEETLPTEKLGASAFRGVHAAILAAPIDVSRSAAVQAQEQGAWAVDVSGAFRVDAAVPLLAPGVNDGLLDRPFSGRIVSLAQPSTQALLSVLQPLRSKFGLTVADVTLLMGVASRGSAAQEQLSKQSAALLNGLHADAELFPHRVAFNIIPAVGGFEAGLCEGERHLLIEAARIWRGGDAFPALTATALTLPIYHGLMLVICAHLARGTDAEAVRSVLKEDQGIKVLDDPAQNIYPMPMLTVDDATTHVGRVRVQGTRVQLVAASDNAFRLADTAVELALKLVARA